MIGCGLVDKKLFLHETFLIKQGLGIIWSNCVTIWFISSLISRFCHITFNPSSNSLVPQFWLYIYWLQLSPCVCFIQVVNQNALWGPTPVLKLWFLRQNRAFQSFFLTSRHRQSPQSQRQLRRQRRLHQRQRQTLTRPRLPANVQPKHAWRWRGLPKTLRGVLWRRCRRFANQVRVHAQRHSQEAVPGVWRHRLRVPLRGGLLWGLQSLFQKDDTRYFLLLLTAFTGSPELISHVCTLSGGSMLTLTLQFRWQLWLPGKHIDLMTLLCIPRAPLCSYPSLCSYGTNTR